MKKIKFIITIALLLNLVSITSLNAQCSVDGYVGNNGTSCAYLGNDGCTYIVTHHRILFGLFKWNTEEQISCVD